MNATDHSGHRRDMTELDAMMEYEYGSRVKVWYDRVMSLG